MMMTMEIYIHILQNIHSEKSPFQQGSMKLCQEEAILNQLYISLHSQNKTV